MDALEAFLKKPADRQEREAEDAVRALGTLSALLAAFPGDMEPLFQDDCINFFITLAGSLEGMGEDAPRWALAVGRARRGPVLEGTAEHVCRAGPPSAACICRLRKISLCLCFIFPWLPTLSSPLTPAPGPPRRNRSQRCAAPGAPAAHRGQHLPAGQRARHGGLSAAAARRPARAGAARGGAGRAPARPRRHLPAHPAAAGHAAAGRGAAAGGRGPRARGGVSLGTWKGSRCGQERYASDSGWTGCCSSAWVLCWLAGAARGRGPEAIVGTDVCCPCPPQTSLARLCALTYAPAGRPRLAVAGDGAAQLQVVGCAGSPGAASASCSPCARSAALCVPCHGARRSTSSRLALPCPTREQQLASLAPCPPRRGESGRDGRLLLPRPQAALLDLAAAVYFHSSCGTSPELADGAAMDEDAFEVRLFLQELCVDAGGAGQPLLGCAASMPACLARPSPSPPTNHAHVIPS